MSATPEQIVDWLMIVAVGDAANEYTNRAEHMRAAAALIRAQAERVRVLEGALRGLTDAYCALLLMKGEDPSRFKEPGSPYAKADAALKGEA